MNTPLKRCTKCGEDKPITEYYKHKQNGLMPWCKDCHKAKNKAYARDNAEKVRVAKAKWAREHPNRNQAWRAAHPEKVKQYHTKSHALQSSEAKQRHEAQIVAWRERNRAAYIETGRRWRRNNPAKVLLMNANRRARLRNAPGKLSHEQWEAIKRAFAYTCPSCGKPEGEIVLTIDHIQPLSQGGTNYADNIQPLCMSCNSRKGARHISYAA